MLLIWYSCHPLPSTLAGGLEEMGMWLGMSCEARRGRARAATHTSHSLSLLERGPNENAKAALQTELKEEGRKETNQKQPWVRGSPAA